MKISDTISVNPGKNTIGHIESSTIFRTPVLGIEKNSRSIDLLNLMFPTVGSGITDYKKYALPLRTLFSTILIVAGLTMMSFPFGPYSHAVAISTLSFGAFLGLGLLTRPIMAGAAIFYCITGALSIRHGMPDITVFCLMFGCALFCLTGAGKYSCDTFLRRSLIRNKRKSEMKRKENLMSYKAFHSVRF